ncbi:hypothetical protein RU86_GL000333 [Lactococcus piscium]|uniref:Gram-positive cocci surface proteins LPxTG domain-containing protein n=2 Tax=Pseudolactococcus piscium TaxID=1364 RepID=A0A2A5RYP4_9LACT|nr:hypothetical protein RU86_GL000333 [Lactococcus piscium]
MSQIPVLADSQLANNTTGTTALNASKTPQTVIASSLSHQPIKPLSSDTIDAWMPDKNLQNVIATLLEKPLSQVTKEDMTSVTRIDLESLPEDTQVNLKGLELAVNLKSLDIANIIATDIPEITMVNNATLFTRSNVLPYIKPKGKFNNIHIGNYTSYRPKDELVGIGQDMDNWDVDMLSIYSIGMTDYSELELSKVNVNYDLSILTNDSIVLNPIEIQDTNESEIAYTDTLLKDTSGNPIISDLSNASIPLSITYIDKNGEWTSLSEGIDYHMTHQGIIFTSIPKDTEKINIQSMVPALFASTTNAFITYGGSYQIPVNHLTTAQSVIVNYVDEQGQAIPNVPSQSISGNVGSSFDASTDKYKLMIAGYTLDETKLPINMTGKLTDQIQTVTYVYTKIKVEPVVPIPNDTPNTLNTETTKASALLPKTGDENDNYLGLGLFLVICTSIISTLYVRSSKQ